MIKGEKQTVRLEAIAKIVTIGVSAIGLIWGGISFLITKRLEARRPYLDYQLELYKETAEVAVKLATSNDPKQLNEAKKRFCELFWGELALVETPEVESQMVKLKDVLDNDILKSDVSNRGTSKKEVSAEISEHGVCDEGLLGKDPSNRRRYEALRLAHTLRSSLAKSWGVDDWEYKAPSEHVNENETPRSKN